MTSSPGTVDSDLLLCQNINLLSAELKVLSVESISYISARLSTVINMNSYHYDQFCLDVVIACSAEQDKQS